MSLETFFEQFELLADAPNGVQKLRELILQLAVQGKLVPQDPNDEHASVLLDKIKFEKQLVQTKNRKIDELFISADETPHELPKGWQWARFGEVLLDIEAGTSPQCEKRSRDKGEWGVLKISAVSWDKFNSEENKALPKGIEPNPQHEVKAGDFLMSRANTSQLVGKSVVVENTSPQLLINDKTLRVSFPTFVNKQFFNLYNNSSAARDYYATAGTGTSTSMRNITREQIRYLPVPVPPLEEQKRIVSKVDRLMQLCDELEERQRERRSHTKRLNEGAIAQLLTATTPDDFTHHWQRICNNFDLLYSLPENITQLRQAILQLAVQGKITRQNTDEEPALALLEMIKSEKEQLAKSGRSKKLINSSPTDALFDLPTNWQWARVNDIAFLVTDGEHATPARILSPEVPLATAKNVRDGYLDMTNTDFVSFETAEKCWRRCEPRHNDILMVCVGATTGRLCLLHHPPKFVLVRSVALVRPVAQYIYPEFVALAIKSPLGQGQVWGNVKQSAQPCLYINKLQNIWLPVPPLHEQKRIVAKVDRLMALCDRLEADLRQAQTGSDRLMETALRQLLAV